MKSSIFFASAASAYAVASTGAYPTASGSAGYPMVSGSSAAPYPVKNASVPVYAASSTIKQAACSGVVTPGYGQSPVTITAQYQTYPSCVATAYGASSCASWGQNTYVSTTIKDYNNQPVCVTNVKQTVTLYATQSTITRTATAGYGGYATPSGGYPNGAKPTGAEYKIDNQGCWYELYQRVEYAQYNQLGSNALKGYSGSNICTDCCNAQPVTVKEYSNGKWSTYTSTQSYGTPTAYATTYATPGVYTVPSKKMTVTNTVYYCGASTKTATAGQTCVYGGNYAVATGVGYMTVPYGTFSAKVSNSKTTTVKVVKTTTIYASKTGTVTICTPTSTVYSQPTSYSWAVVSSYKPGVYSYGAKTVTVTMSNQPYTCPYENRMYPVTSSMGYPTGSKPSSAPGYPTKPTSVPSYGTGSSVPSYQVKSNSTMVNNYAVAKSTPCTLEKKPSPTPSKPSVPYSMVNSYPVQSAKSTPCTLENKSTPTPYQASTPSSMVNYGYAVQSVSSYVAQPVSSYPAQPPANSYPAQPPANSYPANNAYPTPTPANGYAVQPPASTPCTEASKGYATQVPSY